MWHKLSIYGLTIVREEGLMYIERTLVKCNSNHFDVKVPKYDYNYVLFSIAYQS